MIGILWSEVFQIAAIHIDSVEVLIIGIACLAIGSQKIDLLVLKIDLLNFQHTPATTGQLLL